MPSIFGILMSRRMAAYSSPRAQLRPSQASVLTSTWNPCREKIRRQAWQITSSSSTTNNFGLSDMTFPRVSPDLDVRICQPADT